MKKLVFIAVLYSSFVACTNETTKEEQEKISTDVINVPATAAGESVKLGSAPQITFAEEKHNFGRITQGEKVEYSFTFKNTGGSELVISNAQGSCGCTVPTYPKGPVKPGEQSKIDVVFDSEGKSGLVEKTVTINTNCNPSTTVLTISATIDVPEGK
ncbi:MAG: DUF1573 domain-containing protein [Bacteroidia bacterium]